MACNLTTSFFQLSPLNFQRHPHTFAKFPPLSNPFPPHTASSFKLRRCHVSAQEKAEMATVSDEKATSKGEKLMNKRKGKRENGALKEVFGLMDRDGDGEVGFDDLKEFLEMMGMEAGDKKVKAMIKAAGGQLDGGVRFEALAELLSG